MMKSKVTALRSSRSLMVLCGMWLIAGALLLWPHKSKAEETPASTQEASQIETVSNGQIKLAPADASPVFVEFAKSQGMESRIRNALMSRGFELATTREQAKTVVTFSGDLVLLGGPKFYKGVKVPIGEVAERAMEVQVKDGEGTAVSRGTDQVVTVALNVAGYAQGGSRMLSGLQLSRAVESIGDATGMKAWFNSKVAGDPRGVCLSRCGDWNKVRQSVNLVVVSRESGVETTIRVQSKVFAETLMPAELLQTAVDKAFQVASDGKVVAAAQ